MLFFCFFTVSDKVVHDCNSRDDYLKGHKNTVTAIRWITQPICSSTMWGGDGLKGQTKWWF